MVVNRRGRQVQGRPCSPVQPRAKQAQLEQLDSKQPASRPGRLYMPPPTFVRHAQHLHHPVEQAVDDLERGRPVAHDGHQAAPVARAAALAGGEQDDVGDLEEAHRQRRVLVGACVGGEEETRKGAVCWRRSDTDAAAACVTPPLPTPPSTAKHPREQERLAHAPSVLSAPGSRLVRQTSNSAVAGLPMVAAVVPSSCSRGREGQSMGVRGATAGEARGRRTSRWATAS